MYSCSCNTGEWKTIAESKGGTENWSLASQTHKNRYGKVYLRQEERAICTVFLNVKSCVWIQDPSNIIGFSEMIIWCTARYRHVLGVPSIGIVENRCYQEENYNVNSQGMYWNKLNIQKKKKNPRATLASAHHGVASGEPKILDESMSWIIHEVRYRCMQSGPSRMWVLIHPDHERHQIADSRRCSSNTRI